MSVTFHHCRRPAGSCLDTTDDVVICDDGQEHCFRISRKDRRAFKAWAREIFAGGMNRKRLMGAWPSYEVKQP